MADTIFFAPDIEKQQQLSEQESAHAVKVLRMKEGDKLIAADGKGFFYHCTLIQIHPKQCLVSINAKIAEPKSWNFELHLATAPTKNIDRIEWFIEKAAETGIDRFTPLLCRFSERKELKTERLEKITVSAMKQSQQAVVPVIDAMTPFDDFIRQPFEGQKFIAHCHTSEKALLAQRYRKGENVRILIGPEGDFSEEEVRRAIENGFVPISLGKTRLRTETACLAACYTIHVINKL